MDIIVTHDNYTGAVTAENERYRITIQRDEDAESPREWDDNVGTMVCAHQRYILGDEQAQGTHNYSSWREWFEDNILVPDLDMELEDNPDMYDPDPISSSRRYTESWVFNEERAAEERARRIQEAEENIVYLALFLYDHSGITMYTVDTRALYYQHEAWDSGQVGYIYVHKADALKEWGEEEWRERATNYLNGEVKTYDAYLRGDIIGYTIEGVADDNDGYYDGCWGIYPDEDGHFRPWLDADIPEDAHELLDEMNIR